MGRKRVIDLDSYKFSLDVSGENKRVLDELTAASGLKYGPFINKIIEIFCRMPVQIKSVFEETCIRELKEIKRIISVSSGFEKAKLEKNQAYYEEILRLINRGKYEMAEDKVQMIKIPLKSGYLIIPNDWIVVNPERAKSCLYAGVVECRNSEKYGIPHFVFFSDYKFGSEYTDEFTDEIDALCCKSWPEFSNIIEKSKQNELIRDPERPGYFLNIEAHLAAPIIGYFSIDESDKALRKNSLPYGAMIVRN